MNPADKRLIELLEKWLGSIDLHLKYSELDDASYWRVQPWVKHDRPSRWILELARQKAVSLKEHLDSRMAMGDSKFSDALELMAFLSNLVGSEHIERFIPLAEAQNEVDLRTVSQTQQMPTAAARVEPTRESAIVTQPRAAVQPPSATREMPRPPVVAQHAPRAATRDSGRHPHQQKGEPRRQARREAKHGHHAPAARPRASPEREKSVVADAVRLLGWGRKWHELPDLISRMSDRPPTAEIRRILREHKAAIEKQVAKG